MSGFGFFVWGGFWKQGTPWHRRFQDHLAFSLLHPLTRFWVQLFLQGVLFFFFFLVIMKGPQVLLINCIWSVLLPGPEWAKLGILSVICVSMWKGLMMTCWLKVFSRITLKIIFCWRTMNLKSLSFYCLNINSVYLKNHVKSV